MRGLGAQERSALTFMGGVSGVRCRACVVQIYVHITLFSMKWFGEKYPRP